MTPPMTFDASGYYMYPPTRGRANRSRPARCQGSGTAARPGRACILRLQARVPARLRDRDVRARHFSIEDDRVQPELERMIADHSYQSAATDTTPTADGALRRAVGATGTGGGIRSAARRRERELLHSARKGVRTRHRVPRPIATPTGPFRPMERTPGIRHAEAGTREFLVAAYQDQAQAPHARTSGMPPSWVR